MKDLNQEQALYYDQLLREGVDREFAFKRAKEKGFPVENLPGKEDDRINTLSKDQQNYYHFLVSRGQLHPDAAYQKACQYGHGDPVGEPGHPGLSYTPVTYKHSGNTGDIIYALAGMRQIWASQGHQADLRIWLDRPGFYYEGAKHPLGNVTMNQYMFDMLLPLLKHQSYIASVEPYEGQKITVDLDKIRTNDIGMPYGHIARWYFYLFPDMACDLGEPWLDVPPNDTAKDYIIVNRTSRYRNPHISYAFLRYYSNVLFVGTKDEFEDVRKEIPNLAHYQFGSFLELASAIKSCKLFIGNQSMCFALAEAMKSQRVLEICSFAPNVIPQGPNARDFYAQSALEYYVQEICGPRLSKMPPSPINAEIEVRKLLGPFTDTVIANTVVDWPRLLQLAKFIEQTKDLAGVNAEVGVYKGGTAYLNWQLSEKMLLLFDTFEGMPEVSEHDLHHQGDFSDTSLAHVQSLFQGDDQPFMFKGIFPGGPYIDQHGKDQTVSINNFMQFSLVHIDVDIYESVKNCLEFFYPRMVKGGIIVLDDALEPGCPGAKKAFDEFMQDKPEGLKLYMICQSQVAFVKA